MSKITNNQELKSYVEQLTRYEFASLLESDIDNFFSYVYVNSNNNPNIKEYYDSLDQTGKFNAQTILDERLEYWQERS